MHGKFYIGSSPTVGSEVDSKKVEIEDGNEVLLNIWDTAGQERYRSLNKTFYRNALGALVLFDLGDRRTFDDTSRWIS